MNREVFTIRETLIQGFQAINRQLSDLKRALELLAKSETISYYQIDQLKLQVAALAESLHDLEIRVVTLEKHAGLTTWITRQAVTIALVVVVVVAWGWFT